MEKIVQINHAIKNFGKVRALNDVSFYVNKGSICGIIGRNGSGKTILFKAICGFYRLDSGTIIVKEKCIGKDIDIPEGLGSIIETPGFLGNFSGYQNLKYLADIQGLIGKMEIYQAMEMVGLEPTEKKHVRKYSLGMKQRLGIAQAFMEGQDILILDEPMNGLDNEGVHDMRALFKKLKEQGRTLIMASHNKEDIEILCDEVYRMDAGVLIKV